MKVYISGISGTGMGPLALMAQQAGIEVCGSDLHEGAIYEELLGAGIEVKIGEQDGEFLKEKIEDGVEWFVHTSALPEDAPEMQVAKDAGIRISKRDNLTEYLVRLKNLKMVAIAGTHGKTTTTAMTVWLCTRMGLPVSYVVGTTLGFAPSGLYIDGDEYFVYEADEYDKNFLRFYPWLAVITNIDYDHPDIYKTPEDYRDAFEQFKLQSESVLDASDEEGPMGDSFYKIAGEARRQDAAFAMGATLAICQDLMRQDKMGSRIPNFEKMMEALNDFPGVGRRFEKLAEGIYTDYAHHPEEIKATMDVALDQMEIDGKRGVVVVYQPHQNTRQHEVQDLYYDAFIGAEKVFWLPTYLTRENLDLPVLKPIDFISQLENAEVAESAELNDDLWQQIKKYRDDNYLVILMTAGPADEWLRKKV